MSFVDYQAPLHLKLITELNGFEAPDLEQSFSYCDLGCGNGAALNLLAEAYPQGQFYGIDINPEHIDNAQSLATAGGLDNVQFVSESFEEYLREDTPEFDFITVHGIYSWANADIRLQILDLIEKCLKPGGLVFVSYNALPGWAELVPLWKMMHSYTRDMDVSPIDKAKKGLDYLLYLRMQGAGYFRDTPAARKYLDHLLESDPTYVVHELSYDSFEPQYFLDVAEPMQQRGLVYAGDSKFYRNRDFYTIPGRFRSHIEAATDWLGQESQRSFIRNDSFRRDIYVRSTQAKELEENDEAMASFIVGPSVSKELFKETVGIGRREIYLRGPLFDVLVPLVMQGQSTVAELCDHPDLKPFSSQEIVAAVLELMMTGQVVPMLRPLRQVSEPERFRLPSTVNIEFLRTRLRLDGKCYLASGVTGSAMRLSFLPGLFTMALHERTETEALAWAQSELEKLSEAERQRWELDEQVLTSEGLDKEYEKFKKRHMGRLLGYGILEPVSI